MKPKRVSKSATGPDLPRELAQKIKKQVSSLSQTEARQAYLHVLRNLKFEDAYHDALTGKELRVLEGLIVKAHFEAKCLEQRFPQFKGSYLR